MAITILAKGDLVDDRYLRQADTQETRNALYLIKEKKKVLYRRDGFSRDGYIRGIGDIPPHVYNHPAFRHIFHNPDPYEGEKLRKRFLNERTDFRLVDKKV